MERASSWILVRSLTAEPQWELPKNVLIKGEMCWSSRHETAEMDPTRNNEVAGSIPGLAQWVKEQI